MTANPHRPMRDFFSTVPSSPSLAVAVAARVVVLRRSTLVIRLGVPSIDARSVRPSRRDTASFPILTHHLLLFPQQSRVLSRRALQLRVQRLLLAFGIHPRRVRHRPRRPRAVPLIDRRRQSLMRATLQSRRRERHLRFQSLMRRHQPRRASIQERIRVGDVSRARDEHFVAHHQVRRPVRPFHESRVRFRCPRARIDPPSNDVFIPRVHALDTVRIDDGDRFVFVRRRVERARGDAENVG